MKKLNDLAIATYFNVTNFKRKITKKLREDKGQFVMDNAVVIVIIVAVAAVVLTLLISYLKGDLATKVKSSIDNLFSQS
ncbi:MAG: hypothetical protein RSA97_07980 [Oscillospiraceae bacterium]